MEFSHQGDPRYVSLTTEPTGNGATVRELPPSHCPNGHPLKTPNVQVFFSVAPDGERRRGWRCWTCEEVTWAN